MAPVAAPKAAARITVVLVATCFACGASSKGTRTLPKRMGDEVEIRAVVGDANDMNASDPLSGPCLKSSVQAGSNYSDAEFPAFTAELDRGTEAGQRKARWADGAVLAMHEAMTSALPHYLRSLPLPRSSEDILRLSLDEWYALLPLVLVLASPLITLQFVRKVAQAHDLNRNNSGWFQFSKIFYSGKGFWCALPFMLGHVPGALALLAAAWAGQWSWIVFVVGFVLVPIADLFLGEDSYNPTAEEEARLANNIWFRVVTWFHTPIYAATILYGAHVIHTRPELTLWEVAGITSSVGIAGGFGIGCVHELIHRPHFFDLALGVGALVLASYSHFWIEHLWGHHKNVATELDPASSVVGDNVYTFIPRDIFKSFIDAWNLEQGFQRKGGKAFWQNRILQGACASAAIAQAIYMYFGVRALAFYLVQGAIVALLIENTNFIEHYGLRREMEPEGRYERPGWFHAWDTADRVTNWLLFKIQRHPDHHTNAGRAFQILRTLPQSPTLPTGYAGMIVLSWCPPLFRAVMDPLVENAIGHRRRMEAKGVRAAAFPKGANNISSFFKVEGEDCFEDGETSTNAPGPESDETRKSK